MKEGDLKLRFSGAIIMAQPTSTTYRAMSDARYTHHSGNGRLEGPRARYYLSIDSCYSTCTCDCNLPICKLCRLCGNACRGAVC